ncbi:LysR family transcriptional regulator [Alcanivorax sp. S71-1-4]|uniref:LysR family transcriptional regulator n=1 Tax=Alcanivorax sp. S71-1-4 TaxID=1177159 RepID=UPI0019166164|nr:LysR family transcriptional regulator [Alcanivorax sp. S71-1-4]
MQHLRQMAIFARVVEAGAMRRAAESLGMTASAVSQQMRALETSLGLPLLHRSTRRLTMTEAGERYYQHCARMLAAARDAEDVVAALRDSLTGELRITAPVGLAGAPLADALSPLLINHPQLNLSILATDERIDLIHERIDIAVRVGTLPYAGFIAHPLAEFPMLLCAAPAYLDRLGTPGNTADLSRHHWLVLSQVAGQRQLTLHHRQGRTEKLRVSPRVLCNNLNVARHFARRGLGLCLLPWHEARVALASGELVHVLPDWAPPPMPAWALTLERETPAKVSAALALLKRHFHTLQPDVRA